MLAFMFVANLPGLL